MAVWPRIHLGVTLRDDGNLAEAVQILGAAVAIEPENLQGLIEAAETARQWGKPELVISYYRKIIALGSHQVEHYLYLAGQLKRSGLVHDALAVFGQLLRIPNGRTNALAEIRALVRECPELQEDAGALIRQETGETFVFRFIPVASHDAGSAKVPLNQVYRVHGTYRDHPEVFRAHEMFDRISTLSGERKENAAPRPWGRSYDYAVLTSMGIDFKDKRIADLGARDGYLGAWLTAAAAEVYISDHF